MNNESIFLSDVDIIEAKVSFPIASALDCAKKSLLKKYRINLKSIEKIKDEGKISLFTHVWLLILQTYSLIQRTMHNPPP